MIDYVPVGRVVSGIIRKWSNPPTKKIKKRHECYDRVMKLLYGHHSEYEQWLSDPELKKQMQMNVGYLIQDLIGNLKGHTNFREGHPTGLDGENTLNETRILYEIKVDDHTTNGGSLQECINKLERATEHSDTKPLLIQFFRTKNIAPNSKHSKFLISGEDYLNKYVSPNIGGIEGLISEFELKLTVHKLVSDAIDRICNPYPNSSTTGSFR